MRLLGLQFKSDNIMKSKTIKLIVKKILLDIKSNENVLHQLQEKYCKRKFKCQKN